jgi:hypothetical protein
MAKNLKKNRENSETEFLIDDYNFTGYNQEQLRVLCDHRIPLRTRFPKLVTVIMEDEDYIEKVKQNKIEEMEAIENIIKSIHTQIFNYQGNLLNKSINFRNKEFWMRLNELFIERNVINQQKKNNKKNKKNKEKREGGPEVFESNLMIPVENCKTVSKSFKKFSKHPVSNSANLTYKQKKQRSLWV